MPDFIVRWALLAIGGYLIVSGLTARYLINESEFRATEEERRAAKATPLKRIVVVGAGVAALIYSVILFR